MILYHGSNIEIENIDLQKCKLYKDFGRGFYLTEMEEQAQQMANRTAKRYGGTPTITFFNFDENALTKLNIRIFSEPSANWAKFIINNRNRKNENIKDILCNQDCKYDIVIGPVADDNISALLNNFLQNFLDVEMLTRGLTYKKLTNQYSFHTEKAISFLHKEGVK